MGPDARSRGRALRAQSEVPQATESVLGRGPPFLAPIRECQHYYAFACRSSVLTMENQDLFLNSISYVQAVIDRLLCLPFGLSRPYHRKSP